MNGSGRALLPMGAPRRGRLQRRGDEPERVRHFGEEVPKRHHRTVDPCGEREPPCKQTGAMVQFVLPAETVPPVRAEDREAWSA